jgi:hypothetical protein
MREAHKIAAGGARVDFKGIDLDTIANAFALNTAFLALAVTRRPPCLSADFVERLDRLSALERSRLAKAPFLLFTVEPVETGVQSRSPDLFDDSMTDPESRLVAATLCLLWSLARTDQHAARFLAGVPRGGCDDFAAAPLVDVIDAARRFETLVVPRHQSNPAFWRKLFLSATDPRPSVRQAVRHSALQFVLTGLEDDAYTPVAAAACRNRVPSRRRVDS